jgi:hypothetical protein
MFLKQGTTVIVAGPFVKTSDGKTLSTGETLSTAKVKLSKNGAAFANKACTNASVYSAHGFYRIFLTTADSGTPGVLVVSALATACLPVFLNMNVVKANPYDSIIIGSDYLDVNDGTPVKNTAFNNIEFLMVGSSDHYTGKTGLTVTGERSLDGSTFAALSTDSAIAEVANGIYQLDAAAADMNGSIVTFRLKSTGGSDDTFVTVKTVTR